MNTYDAPPERVGERFELVPIGIDEISQGACSDLTAAIEERGAIRLDETVLLHEKHDERGEDEHEKANIDRGDKFLKTIGQAPARFSPRAALSSRTCRCA